MASQAFISHVSEEAALALRLKTALSRDFLGLLGVFVASDGDSIAAGEEWLRSIERALRESALMVVLCSPTSIGRPWINFEAGAAWMHGLPIVPVCHDGLTPRDLPMPLSLRQGIALSQAGGLKRLYERVARVLECQVPSLSFDELCREIAGASPPVNQPLPAELTRDREIRERLIEALKHPDFHWRTMKRVAAEAAISEELAADLLRADQKVCFSKGKSGNVIVGLRSRVRGAGNETDYANG